VVGLAQWFEPVILSGGRDQEDLHLRPAQAKSSSDPISTNKKLGVGRYTPVIPAFKVKTGGSQV
jgi:hypothetical protein